MFFYKSENVDPKYNLAIEEYLTTSKKYKDQILFLWQNDNTIVIGRNQNVLEEVDLKTAKQDKITVIRRNTGGGAVFHDLGNLNFSIIYTSDNNPADMFVQMLEPVIKTLNQMGVNAIFSGRNDITLNDKKISGNAMWKYENRFLQHGTILFDVNLEKLNRYLLVNKEKILSKNIKSVSARVTNINAEIKKPITVKDFISQLLQTYANNKEIQKLVLNDEDKKLIFELYNKKYNNEEWTFKKHTTFTYQNKKWYENKGSVEVFLNIVNNTIIDAKIYGDFLGFEGTEILEKKLIGLDYNFKTIKYCLEQVDIKKIFGQNFINLDILNLLI